MRHSRLLRMPTLCGALLISTITAAGQKTTDPASVAEAAGSMSPQSTPRAQPQLTERYPRYAIQREDVLAISFPLSPELNQTVTVQPDGFITLESAGSLHIQGMTVPQAVVAIKSAYTGTLHDPIVNIDLQDFQKPFFTVSGEVSKPGQYELRSNITVTEAIAVAGGLASTAKTQVFLFHRANDSWYQVETLNLKAVLNGKKVDEDAILRPGDMIFVPESSITKFRKLVPYSVNAGSYLATNP